MTHTPRLDEHRPSVINPQDYLFVSWDYTGGDEDMLLASFEDRKYIKDFAKSKNIPVDFTGDGCMCCGARPSHWGVFFHSPSNSLVRFGHQCSQKMRIIHSGEFRKYRKGLNTRVIHLDNVRKAKSFCDKQELNLERFAENNNGSYEQRVLRDMWFRLVENHELSEKTVQYAKTLIHKVENPVVIKEPTETPVAGRHEINGKILGFKTQEGPYGDTLKALIETPAGWKLFVSVPSGSNWQKGEDVALIATIEISLKDKFFAFGKRPKAIAKAEGKR